MRAWLVMLAACGSSGDSKPSPKPTVVAPAAAADAAGDPWASNSADPSIPAPPKLAVVSHGAEPRKVMTYTVGQLQRTVTFRADDDMDIRMVYALSCTPCRYQMTEFSIGGDASQMAGLAKGISGTIELTPDGTATIPAGIVKTTPSTPSLFEMAIVRFPTEPIGAGAKWSVGTSTKNMVYTLVALSDRNAKVELAGFEGNGDAIAHVTGQLTVSFTDPVARGALKQRTAITLAGGATHEQTIALAIE